MSKQLIADYKEALINLCVALDEAGFGFLYVITADPKIVRFADRMGFKPLVHYPANGAYIQYMRTDE